MGAIPTSDVTSQFEDLIETLGPCGPVQVRFDGDQVDRVSDLQVPDFLSMIPILGVCIVAMDI